MEKFIAIIQNNYEWVFSGIGVTAIAGIIGIIKKFGKSSKNNQNTGPTINAHYDNVVTGQNITGNNNIINVTSANHAANPNATTSLFAKRFFVFQELLNNSRLYGEKEYTLEYISSLVGIKNVSELKKYVYENEEPDDCLKQKFVDIFGLNQEWMLYNQGEYPFATNLKKYTNGATIFDNGAMDILRNEKLSQIRQFIIVIGQYNHRNSSLIIRKTSDLCYELYPYVFDLDPDVGGTGRNKLVSFYRFLREADRIGKLAPFVYRATEKEFSDLYKGAVAPLSVKKSEIIRCFTMDFLDLSEARFDDKKLIQVKVIIKNAIKDVDYYEQETDLTIIQKNLLNK